MRFLPETTRRREGCSHSGTGRPRRRRAPRLRAVEALAGGGAQADPRAALHGSGTAFRPRTDPSTGGWGWLQMTPGHPDAAASECLLRIPLRIPL